MWGLGAPTLHTVKNPQVTSSQPSVSVPHPQTLTTTACSTAVFTTGKNLCVNGRTQFKPVLQGSAVLTLKMKNVVYPSETC